jgi:uncharacterized Fe-S cluster protein YjdI
MDDRLHVFESPQIRVSWSRPRCIHAARCIRGLPEVFEPGRRPWVMPANAPADEVAAVVRRCPTGALHLGRLDGGPGEEPMRETRVGLCRCGASKFKPFCDGSHWESGFRDGADEGNRRE